MEPRPSERPEDASAESGARSREVHLYQTTPKPTHTLAGGPGAAQSAPVPFGYFRADESNRKTRACQGGEVELKRKNEKA